MRATIGARFSGETIGAGTTLPCFELLQPCVLDSSVLSRFAVFAPQLLHRNAGVLQEANDLCLAEPLLHVKPFFPGVESSPFCNSKAGDVPSQ